MIVSKLEDIDSFYAMQAVHKLLFGLKMLPSYGSLSYEEFFVMVDAMPEPDQEKMFREAAVFVKLDKEEMFDLMRWVKDANGVSYGANNTKSLKPEQIHSIMVAVCMQVMRDHKIDFLNASEKKNLKIGPSMSEPFLQDIQT